MLDLLGPLKTNVWESGPFGTRVAGFGPTVTLKKNALRIWDLLGTGIAWKNVFRMLDHF